MGGRNIFKKTLTTAREGHTSPSPLSNGIEGFSEFQHPPFREEDGKDAKIGRFFVNIWVSFLMEFFNKLEKRASRQPERRTGSRTGLQTLTKASRHSEISISLLFKHVYHKLSTTFGTHLVEN